MILFMYAILVLGKIGMCPVNILLCLQYSAKAPRVGSFWFTKKEIQMAKYEHWITPEGLTKIEGWARDGLTDEQIAHNVGIAVKTLYEWKNRYSDIREALKKGKDVPDREVENALYKRAIGGIQEVKKTFKVKETYYDGSGRKCEKEELKTGIDEVYIPGDTTAQIFWLKNRKPKQWRDKQDIFVDNDDHRVVIINDTRNQDKQ